MSGLLIVDLCLPIGRGQRQLIIGDRFTGKTSLYLAILLCSVTFSSLLSIDGFGAKRLFGIFVGIGLSLSKLSAMFMSLRHSCYLLIISSHSSSSALLAFLIPLIGISVCEMCSSSGSDTCICFDSLSGHSKAYRQISLILSKIPGRDAFPADIFNIHSSLLERCGKVCPLYSGSATSGYPIVTCVINGDITEFITTNIISITSSQCGWHMLRPIQCGWHNR